MKINEVLAAYNNAIDHIREEKGYTNKGHFVAIEDIKKAMGSYKQMSVSILYHNTDSNVNYPFAGARITDKCPAGMEEMLMTKCELAALTKFFQYCSKENIFESILSNSYDRIK